MVPGKKNILSCGFMDKYILSFFFLPTKYFFNAEIVTCGFNTCNAFFYNTSPQAYKKQTNRQIKKIQT